MSHDGRTNEVPALKSIISILYYCKSPNYEYIPVGVDQAGRKQVEARSCNECLRRDEMSPVCAYLYDTPLALLKLWSATRIK